MTTNKRVRPDEIIVERGRPIGRSQSAPRAAATVEVTERALDALATLRAAEQAGPRQALGLVLGPVGSVTLVLDFPGTLDRVFTRDETPIFFVSADVVARFRGRILDREGSAETGTFVLSEREAEEPIVTHEA